MCSWKFSSCSREGTQSAATPYGMEHRTSHRSWSWSSRAFSCCIRRFRSVIRACTSVRMFFSCCSMLIPSSSCTEKIYQWKVNKATFTTNKTAPRGVDLQKLDMQWIFFLRIKVLIHSVIPVGNFGNNLLEWQKDYFTSKTGIWSSKQSFSISVLQVWMLLTSLFFSDSSSFTIISSRFCRTNHREISRCLQWTRRRSLLSD